MASSLTKARNFTFILYPESIPGDWLERLEKLDIPMAISPLHDKDIDTKNGGLKKPHYHVMYIARNPVTVESIRKKIKRALGDKSLSHIEIIDSVKNVYLYLTHESKDAIRKNKYVYDSKDLIHLNDFDISRYVTLDEHQKRELKNKLLLIANDYHLLNFADLVAFVRQEGKQEGITNLEDVLDVMGSSVGMFRLVFDSNYQNGYRARYATVIDYETGEIK